MLATRLLVAGRGTSRAKQRWACGSSCRARLRRLADGFVVPDPVLAAHDAAPLLEAAGCQAAVILDAEPGLPIAFVKTDALISGALVFRKHVLKMGQKPPAWTRRS